MSRRLSFSKLALAERCLYPFRSDVPLDPFVPEQPALTGTAFGEWAYATIVGVPCLEPVGLDEESLEKLEVYKQNWIRGDYNQAEIAIALNVVTGQVRTLGQNIGREYDKHGAGPDDVCGSIDACSVELPWVNVGEWKTGSQRKLDRYGNKQARGYAAALAQIYGAEGANVEVQVINEDGAWQYDETMFADDIAAELASIIRKAEEIELTNPSPNPGEWCKECPAAGGCPALAKTAEEIVKHRLPVLQTTEDVAAVIVKLETLEAQANAIWKLIDARVAELGTVTLPSGREYGECERHVESVIANDAMPILQAEGLNAAVKTSLTKKSIKEAVRAVAKKGEMSKMERDVLQKLRDAGALKESVKTYIGFRK